MGNFAAMTNLVDSRQAKFEDLLKTDSLTGSFVLPFLPRFDGFLVRSTYEEVFALCHQLELRKKEKRKA